MIVVSVRLYGKQSTKDSPVNKSVCRGFCFIVVLCGLVQRLRRRCGRSSIRCCRIWMSGVVRLAG